MPDPGRECRKRVLGVAEFALGSVTDTLEFEMVAEEALDAAYDYQQALVRCLLQDEPLSAEPNAELESIKTSLADTLATLSEIKCSIPESGFEPSEPAVGPSAAMPLRSFGAAFPFPRRINTLPRTQRYDATPSNGRSEFTQTSLAALSFSMYSKAEAVDELEDYSADVLVDPNPTKSPSPTGTPVRSPEKTQKLDATRAKRTPPKDAAPSVEPPASSALALNEWESGSLNQDPPTTLDELKNVESAANIAMMYARVEESSTLHHVKGVSHKAGVLTVKRVENSSIPDAGAKESLGSYSTPAARKETNPTIKTAKSSNIPDPPAHKEAIPIIKIVEEPTIPDAGANRRFSFDSTPTACKGPNPTIKTVGSLGIPNAGSKESASSYSSPPIHKVDFPTSNTAGNSHLQTRAKEAFDFNPNRVNPLLAQLDKPRQTPVIGVDARFAVPPSAKRLRPALARCNRLQAQLHRSSSRPHPMHELAAEVEAGRYGDENLPHHPSLGSQQWEFVDSKDLPSLPDFSLSEEGGSHQIPVFSPLPPRRLATPRIVKPVVTTPNRSPPKGSVASPSMVGHISARSIELDGYSGDFGLKEKPASLSAQVDVSNPLELLEVELSPRMSLNQSFDLIQAATPSFLRSQVCLAPEALQPSSPLLALQAKLRASTSANEILDESLLAYDSRKEVPMAAYPEWCHPGPALDQALKRQESIDPRTVFGEFRPVNINDLLQPCGRRIQASPPPVIKPWSPPANHPDFPWCNFRQTDFRGLPYQRKVAPKPPPKPRLPPVASHRPIHKPRLVSKSNLPNPKPPAKLVLKQNFPRRV
ncbi:hypothetical protein L0F63_006101 [Massospora cicadina]|nr:hypothetical protein L0F63_006101 [Massospora cicadina]